MGDAAGIKAALRGTDMLLKEGMSVKVLLLPDGDDPDSFAKKHNASEFHKYITEHQADFIEFKTRLLLEGVTDPMRRSEAISSIIKSVSVIGDPIVRATYIQDCASRLGIQEQILIAKMNDNIREYRSEQRKEEERKRRSNTYIQQNYNSTDNSRKRKALHCPLRTNSLLSMKAMATHHHLMPFYHKKRSMFIIYRMKATEKKRRTTATNIH